MVNFEFKARLVDAQQVRAVLQNRGAKYSGILRQRDTYFAVPQGRLKLREIEHQSEDESHASENQLIFYQRSDLSGVKRSDYHIAPVSNAEEMRALLSAALGVRSVVNKTRELYLLLADDGAPAIRVHLDSVFDLGEFVEVEALMEAHRSAEETEQAAMSLLNGFGVGPEDLLSHSYADMIGG